MDDNGSFVAADVIPRERIPDTFPDWSPADMVKWLNRCGDKFPAKQIDLYVRLVTDPRMREVWRWYADAANPGAFLLCHNVHASCRLPSFPGNLGAAERKAYLAKVRQHANSLIELLRPTWYGANSAISAGFSTEEMDNDKLAEIVEQDLASWGADETGHVVAYYVDEDGVSRMPWSYPASSVCDLLLDVVEWTELEDYWDLTRSSKPIESTKGTHRHVTYFTRSLYEHLARYGVTIPFAQLATVANVALTLPVDAQLDEDAARKQVRRYYGKQDIATIYGPGAF
ncbi:MAG: hypothetical protein V4567_02390 [Pseudomonadota bacterium]